MRMPNLIIVMAAAILLSSCATTGQSTTRVASNFIQRQHVTTITKDIYPEKNPQMIALFDEEKKPLTPYRVIGKASVSKHNLLGMQRHDKTVDQMMKNLAASVGGDGLININNSEEKMEANIIQFQKIMI